MNTIFCSYQICTLFAATTKKKPQRASSPIPPSGSLGQNFKNDVEDEHEPLDTDEEEVVRSVAKQFIKKPLTDYPETQNDLNIAENEATMDRVEAELEQLHKEENEDRYSPLIVGVKESRLLENFRYEVVVLLLFVRLLSCYSF